VETRDFARATQAISTSILEPKVQPKVLDLWRAPAVASRTGMEGLKV
jgi:hypothetical protein